MVVNYESNENTENSVEQVIRDNPDIIKKYQSGQVQVMGFLIGQVQKLLSGKGNPKVITSFLSQKIHG